MYSRLVLAVVDVGENKQADDGPREELLGLEAEGERLPALLEGLERAAEAGVVVAEDLRGGEDAEVHLGRDADLEVEVARVAGGGGEAVLEAGVRVGLVLEAEAGLELLDGGLERGHVRGLEALEAAELGVHGDDDDDGLELLGGEEAEEELGGAGRAVRHARALVVQHGGEGRGDAQVDVVGEGLLVGAAARRDDAHVEQLREERVRGAHDGGGLRGGGAAPGGRELRVAEGGQELERVGDEALGGGALGGGALGGVRRVRGVGRVRGVVEALHRWHGALRAAHAQRGYCFLCVY